MKKPLIVGVMGGGNATETMNKDAYKLGKLIAEKGWVLLNGGRNTGIMEASAKGACENSGLTIGILPGSDPSEISEYIKIPVLTEMGNARNCINVLTSTIIVACPGGAGTISEIALAMKSGKKVILMNFNPGTTFDKHIEQGDILCASSPEEVVKLIAKLA